MSRLNLFVSGGGGGGSVSGNFLPLTGGTMLGVLTLQANAAGLVDATGSAGSSGKVLTINGSGFPAWTASAGSLPLTTLGDTLYEDATPTPVRLAGNITATKKFLTQTGNGSISAAPAWGTVAAADITVGTMVSGMTFVAPVLGTPASGTLTNTTGYKWSSLAAASANVTLANTSRTTTFTQTSAIAWLWQNLTAATSGVAQSSPLLELSGTTWTGASATDTWSIQNVTAINGTSGASGLVFGYVAGPGNLTQVCIGVGGTSTSPALAIAAAGPSISNAGFGVSNVQGVSGLTAFLSVGSYFTIQGTGANPATVSVGTSSGGGTPSILQSLSLAGTNVGAPWSFQATGGFNNTAAGSYIFELAGGNANVQNTSGVAYGVYSHGMTFSPASGAGTYAALSLQSTINQTGSASGSYTALLVNITETALLGAANNLLDLQAGASGGTSKFTVNNSGKLVTYNGETTAGIGSSYVRGSTSQKAETGADASVLSVTPASAAGTYRISIVLSVSAASVATLGWTATWTDSNGNAQAPTNLALTTAGSATSVLTLTAAANGTYYGSVLVDVNNAGTAIVVKTTFSGTSIAYKASATIERVQ